MGIFLASVANANISLLIPTIHRMVVRSNTIASTSPIKLIALFLLTSSQELASTKFAANPSRRDLVFLYSLV